MPNTWREVPPTAGLPLVWRDLLPGDADLGAAVARFLQLPETQIECSGTAALVLALRALQQDSKQRRKVILPAYTCPLVALAIAHCGLQPILCDLRANSFDLDHDQLAQLCDTSTLAVIPTHLGGRIADLEPVLDIAARTGALVIEDAAQALGGLVQGRPVGSIGDIGFWSLAVGKGLTLYEGGVLTARDTGMRQRLRQVSAECIPHNAAWELKRCGELFAYWALYRPLSLRVAYGQPLRSALRRDDPVAAVGDDFDAAIPLHRVSAWRRGVGVHALSRLADFQQNLNAQAARRKQQLAQIAGIQVLDDAPGTQGAWPFFMLLLPTVAVRDAALETLWTSGLGVSRLFIHALPDYGYLTHLFEAPAVPHARDFAARMLTVSNSPWLDDAGFVRVLSALSAAVNRG